MASRTSSIPPRSSSSASSHWFPRRAVFAEKDAFRAELRAEIELHAQGWEQRLASGTGEAHAILRNVRPFMAHRALRPFLEAYVVVADSLVQLGSQAYEESSFLAAALALGRQYALQRRLHRAESVSKTLFASAANLAVNRGLTTAAPDLVARRRAFAGELQSILRRIDAVDALQAGRRAGVL
jgi:glycerol-3-phosphate O-acyltransferase